MIDRRIDSVKRPDLKFLPAQVVYSAVVPEMRGMVIGIFIDADWGCRYEVTWESMTTSSHSACELQLEPLVDDDDDTTTGFGQWETN